MKILSSKSVSLRSDREVYFGVWYEPKNPLNRNKTYHNVTKASVQRVARLLNKASAVRTEREVAISVTAYSDGNFGVIYTFYVWGDEAVAA